MQTSNVSVTFEAPSQARTNHLPDVPIQEARARLGRALQAEGFSMIADITVATLHPRRLLEAVGRAHLAEVATRIVELVARKLDAPPGAAR